MKYTACGYIPCRLFWLVFCQKIKLIYRFSMDCNVQTLSRACDTRLCVLLLNVNLCIPQLFTHDVIHGNVKTIRVVLGRCRERERELCLFRMTWVPEIFKVSGSSGIAVFGHPSVTDLTEKFFFFKLTRSYGRCWDIVHNDGCSDGSCRIDNHCSSIFE